MNDYEKITLFGLIFLMLMFLAFSVGCFLGLVGLATDLSEQVGKCERAAYVSRYNK